MIVWLSAGAAASPGWSVQTGWISSGGPDHYGTLSVSAHTSPGTRVGALLVGGTRSAVLGSAARTLELEPGIGLDLGLWLGMIRTTSADRGGPLGGGEVALRLELQPAVAVAVALDGAPGLGVRASAGVDRDLSERWTLSPRLRLDTWAGDRDPGLRAALGLGWRGPDGSTISAEVSAGGRDVLHVGPGLRLAVGRW